MTTKPIRRYPRIDVSKMSVADKREFITGLCRREILKLRASHSFKNADVLPVVANLFDAVLFLANLGPEQQTK